jgi:tocopherol O-methyltransferase
MVDVGCGIGGSSRHISRMFGCTAQGITLSPVQAARANELSKAAGLGDKCRFQVRDVASPYACAVHMRVLKTV